VDDIEACLTEWEKRTSLAVWFRGKALYESSLIPGGWHPHRRAARPVAASTATVLMGSQLPNSSGL
jgi:hypothetical protein